MMMKWASKSFIAIVALLASQPLANADALKITPSLAGFKQIGPRKVELVFALNVQEKVPEGYGQFVHVTTPGTDRPAFQLGTGINTKPETWEPGQNLTGPLMVMPLAADLADGDYEIKFGLYNLTKGNRLELTGKNDGQRRYILGTMAVSDGGQKITMEGVPAVTPAMEGRINVTPGIVDFQQVGPRQLAFRLTFDVQEKLPANQEVFVHYTYANPAPGKDTFMGSGSGIAGSPDSWTVGQKTIGDVVTITLPASLPDGTYNIRTGMYAPKGDNSRVKLTGKDDGGRRFIVGTFQVSENGGKIVLVP